MSGRTSDSTGPDEPVEPSGRPASANGEAADPRGFSRATGVVFQTVGLVLAVGGCCLWSLSGKYQTPLPGAVPVRTLGDWVTKAQPAQLCSAVAIAASFAAGLAFVALGMGLSSERRWSGRWAMVASGLLFAVWLVELLLFALWARSIVGAVVAFVLLAVAAGLFLLAGGAARELRLHPPPADMNVVPSDFEALLHKARQLPSENGRKDD